MKNQLLLLLHLDLLLLPVNKLAQPSKDELTQAFWSYECHLLQKELTQAFWSFECLLW